MSGAPAAHTVRAGMRSDVPGGAGVVRSGPLDWLQQWHWFERTIPERRRVNPTPLAAHSHLPAGVTLTDVHAALARLLARHEALRTTVDPVRPVQHVHRADSVRLPVDHLDVTALDPDTVAAATTALATEPIDAEHDPPWHARVLVQAGTPRAVVLAADHVAIDGWGLVVLLDQLDALLRGDDGPAREPVHPLDTLAWQRPERARAAERDWLARYAGNPAGVLAPFGGVPGGAGRHRVRHRSTQAYDDLDRLAGEHRVSREVVGLAALAHEVAARTGEHRLLASVVVAHRARAALRDSVGSRALTVPVQIDLTPGASFPEVLGHVAAACAAAYRQGRYRVAELVAAQVRADRERGIRSGPAIEYNCYTWPRRHPTSEPPPPPGGAATWVRSTPDEPCDTLYVDLDLDVGRDTGVATVDVTVGDHLLDADAAVELPARLCALLHAVAGGADRPVPERSRVPAAPGWWRAPQGWVRPATVETVLRGHPGVSDVEVRPACQDEEGGAHLVAYAGVAPGVTAGDLRVHVLDHLDEVPGLLAPRRYALSTGGSAAEHGGDRAPSIPYRPPGTTSEWALALAVATVRSGAPPADDAPDGPLSHYGGVDMNRSLADHAVDLVAIPRVLALLHSAGLTGIASDELAGTTSLGRLAAALEPVSARRRTTP